MNLPSKGMWLFTRHHLGLFETDRGAEGRGEVDIAFLHRIPLAQNRAPRPVRSLRGSLSTLKLLLAGDSWWNFLSSSVADLQSKFVSLRAELDHHIRIPGFLDGLEISIHSKYSSSNGGYEDVTTWARGTALASCNVPA